MNILILHRVPYQRVDYARGIDHNQHDVTYFGVRDILDTLPTDLRCIKVERPGKASAFEEARAWLEAQLQQFDRVIALSEYELLDAARLREWLGVSGAKVDEVSCARQASDETSRGPGRVTGSTVHAATCLPCQSAARAMEGHHSTQATQRRIE